MPFILTAIDYADALPRRLAARDAHLQGMADMKARGQVFYAAAHLAEEGSMKGSTLILGFETREEVDAYLAREPYMTNNVWESVSLTPCRVPELFK